MIFEANKEFMENLSLQRGAKWYDHKPQPMLESEVVKMLWDFKIKTD